MDAKQMKQTNLDSVLLDFHVEAGGGPTPRTLENYCRQYPEYARELTDYAVQWLIGEAMAASQAGSAPVEQTSSPLVSRAISRLYDRLRERDLVHEAGAQARDLESHDVIAELAGERFRAIRDQLGIDTPLMSKLRNRLIDPNTVRRPFLERLAQSFERSVEEVLGYLNLPPMVHARASFKTEGKPAVGAQKESFDEAVRKSSLDEERKRTILQD